MVQVGYGTIPGQTFDLASLQLNQRQLAQQKQQQQTANLMAIAEAVMKQQQWQKEQERLKKQAEQEQQAALYKAAIQQQLLGLKERQLTSEENRAKDWMEIMRGAYGQGGGQDISQFIEPTQQGRMFGLQNPWSGQIPQQGGNNLQSASLEELEAALM